MPTPRCLPPTPKRSTHRVPGGVLPPTAQALPMTQNTKSPKTEVPQMPKPSARMSLRAKVFRFFKEFLDFLRIKGFYKTIDRCRCVMERKPLKKRLFPLQSDVIWYF